MSRAHRKIAFFFLFLIVWAFCAPFLAERLIVEKTLPRADAILILSGSQTSAERTRKAAELFKKGAAPRIYLTDDGGQSGWSHKEQRNPPFVELARSSLVEQGVPPENIEILPQKVAGTIDEARLLSEKAKAANLKSILLVTSAYHTRRALATFEKVFAADSPPVELGIASPPPGEQTPAPEFWWLSAFGWEIVAGEYVKSFGYWVYY